MAQPQRVRLPAGIDSSDTAAWQSSNPPAQPICHGRQTVCHLQQVTNAQGAERLQQRRLATFQQAGKRLAVLREGCLARQTLLRLLVCTKTLYVMLLECGAKRELCQRWMHAQISISDMLVPST